MVLSDGSHDLRLRVGREIEDFVTVKVDEGPAKAGEQHADSRLGDAVLPGICVVVGESGLRIRSASSVDKKEKKDREGDNGEDLEAYCRSAVAGAGFAGML